MFLSLLLSDQKLPNACDLGFLLSLQILQEGRLDSTYHVQSGDGRSVSTGPYSYGT